MMALYSQYKNDIAEKNRLAYNCATLRVSHLTNDQKFLNYPIYDAAFVAGMNHVIKMVAMICHNSIEIERADLKEFGDSPAINQSAAESQAIGALDAYQTVLNFIKPSSK
jgi:hypothetical protein